MPEPVLIMLIQVLSPLLLAVLAWAAAEAARWIRSKTRNEALAGALTRAVHAVEVAVEDTEQTLVRELKARAADGTLTREDARLALEAALERAQGNLGARGVAAVRDVLGQDQAAVEAYLVSLIEAKIRGAKST